MLIEDDNHIDPSVKESSKKSVLQSPEKSERMS